MAAIAERLAQGFASVLVAGTKKCHLLQEFEGDDLGRFSKHSRRNPDDGLDDRIHHQRHVRETAWR